MTVQLPPCPVSLKAIQHYLKTASEHDGRDAVISYWCRLFALQSALKIDKKSDEAKQFLMALMTWLEREKKNLADNESITNDIAAQAHIENYALRVFLWADGQDRNGIFNKNVVKAFYTAAMLMDVLTTFGELTEEIQNNNKYAKWKAAYIHNCLKNGETPIPGPLMDESGSEAAGGLPSVIPSSPNPTHIGFEQPRQPPMQSPYGQQPPGNLLFPTPPTSSSLPSVPAPAPDPQPNIPPSFTPHTATPSNVVPDDGISNSFATETGVKLTALQITKAQKFCKFAASALNYDDVTEAVSNLTKALRLLQTGEES